MYARSHRTDRHRDGASDVRPGRFPNGADTGSNCTDSLTAPTTTLAAPAASGAINIKVASVADLDVGHTLRTGGDLETAVTSDLGTPRATTVTTGTAAGAIIIPVTSMMGFSDGETSPSTTGQMRKRRSSPTSTGEPPASPWPRH